MIFVNSTRSHQYHTFRRYMCGFCIFIQEQFLISMLERRLEFPHANGRYSVDAMSSHLLNKFINLQVKTPTLFLLGAQDLRVPVSNGLQVSPCASVLMYGWVKGLFHISSFSKYLSVGFLLLFFSWTQRNKKLVRLQDSNYCLTI